MMADTHTRARNPATRCVELAELAAFLRRLHPRDTATNVSAETGIAYRTVQGWLQERYPPRLDAFLTLVRVYGPDVLAAALPDRLGWLDAARQDAEADRIRTQMAAMTARLAQLEHTA
ncbi:MAG: hypothetical protein AAF311_14770 [Pseudomonadota bacterium]